MISEFNNDYTRLKNAVEGKNELSISMLTDLVNKYSHSEKLQTEAILLDSEFADSNSDENIKAILFDEIMKIAEQVSDEKENVLSELDIKNIQLGWFNKRKNKDIVFSCRGLHKEYSKSGFKLKNINLDLKAGEITGVIGENGNGKTTLLKIIAGEMSPGGGTVSYGSLQKEDAVRWDMVKPEIAYLSQELGRLEGPVKRSIQYAAALHGIKPVCIDKEVDYIIQRLGLNKFKNSKWQDLSGGYKLRFALATILVWKPKLLVLDEPLANLDINTQVRVLNDIRDLSKSIKNPMAVILSSQNIEEVESASDNMIVLSNGEIIFNNQTTRAGEFRNANLFEFKTDDLREEVEEKLLGLQHSGLDFNGFSYFIKTPLQITESVFFSYCVKHEIELTLFQNIGISTKSMIVQTNL